MSTVPCEYSIAEAVSTSALAPISSSPTAIDAVTRAALRSHGRVRCHARASRMHWAITAEATVATASVIRVRVPDMDSPTMRGEDQHRFRDPADVVRTVQLMPDEHAERDAQRHLGGDAEADDEEHHGGVRLVRRSDADPARHAGRQDPREHGDEEPRCGQEGRAPCSAPRTGRAGRRGHGSARQSGRSRRRRPDPTARTG